tara:strand:+ start:1680 stop:3164 length:1485 start_codon:yes stop_codon:yes gene_type:complete
MADIFKSGFIGMGSKVYVGLQSDYKTTATSVRDYACPIQPGSRPAKQIESLQVDQLFPTFLRKKPLPSAVRVEGTYSMYFPQEKILGASGLDELAEMADPTSGTFLDLWIQSMLGKVSPTLYYVDNDTDKPQASLLGDTSASATDWIFAKYKMDTGIPSMTFVHKVFEASQGSVAEIEKQRYAVISGAKCSSATFNFSADSPVTADFNFLALDEKITEAPTAGSVADAQAMNYNNIEGITSFDMTNGIFGPNYGHAVAHSGSPLVPASGSLAHSVKSADTSATEKTTDLFPNWATQLFLKPKSVTGSTMRSHGTTINLAAAMGANPMQAEGDYRIPFMDFSFTINNNLDYPTANNGSQYPSEPILTATKEVTGSLTLPFTDEIIDLLTGGSSGSRKTNQFQDFLNLKNFEMAIVLSDPTNTTNPGAERIVISFPEICFTGTALGDIPQGEITMPLSFAAYQPADVTTTGTPSTLGTTQSEACTFYVGRRYQYDS